MTDAYQTLTAKEKQTLRLMVRGHDTKSVARELGLSVHTVNERLREARRKLGASSSREAARRLFESESADPELLGDKPLGDAARSLGMTSNNHRAVRRRWAWIIGGVLIMMLILSALALTLAPVATSPAAPRVPQVTPADAATAAEATRSAQAWLALVDQGRWDDSWNASGLQFRKLNTSKVWADISQAVRPPLGTVRSRTAISQEKVPAPPHGYLIVKFHTSFANKPRAVETVSLEREDQVWKVVGYWIA